MNTDLSELFERDLLRLRDEITNFKVEDNLWRKPNGISNAAGNLALHLCGNLNTYVGDLLGNSGYVRNRDLEFSASGVPRHEIVSAIIAVAEVVKVTLTNLPQQQLEDTFPLDFLGTKSTTFYLLQLYGHLNYHLGQVNYLRRILED
ncbi:DinB family protein [Inquilinus sp. KBS0705]|nr:DinB family protein [Inquilinus sp. KBS0705]